MASGLNLTLGLFAVGVFALGACGGTADLASSDPPGAESEAELATGAASLKGRWKSSENTYLQHANFNFNGNGTFLGNVNVERLDGQCSSAPPDCTEITVAKFKTRRGNTLVLEVPKLVEVTPSAKTLTFHYELSADRKHLVLDGDAGQQTFDYYAGCEEDLHCTNGLECVEKPDWGGAKCGHRPVPVPHH